MAGITIDLSEDGGDFCVENPMGFDLRIVGCGLQIDLTAEQAEALFRALKPFFVDDAAENAREGGNGR